MGRRKPSERQSEVPAPPTEGRFERRAWIAVYVVIVAFLAVGAARRIWTMF